MKIIKAQPGKKIYKHNDYYGYINKIQAQATANPEWFWSDSADASEARQWLYDNGASAVVDEIYRNTPAEIQKTINSRKLSRKVSDERGTQQLLSDIHSAQKNFMDTAGAIGLQSAGTVALGTGLVLAPEVTIPSLVGGLAGGYSTDKIVQKVSDGKYSTFGSFVRQNNDWGQTGNLLAEFANPGFYIGGGAAAKIVGRTTPMVIKSMQNRLWKTAKPGQISETEKLRIPKSERSSRPISEFEKNGKYTLDELHQMGFKLPRKHLQGEDAVQMFKEYGTKYPETTRLYRVTGTSGNFTPSPDGTAEFAGQWFSSDPTKGLLYGSRTAKEARKLGIENPIELQVVDIPNSQLERYRASNILKGRSDIEFEPTEDFLIPLDMTRGRAPMNFTGNIFLDNKLELPNIPKQDTPLMYQLRRYVPEARERYGLVGNTNITDDEIAGSLYKKVLDLGGDTAAKNEFGEPLVLFRGSTKRNLRLYPKGVGEQQMSGADNILGNLFLGELPGTRKGQGLERYLGVVWDSNGVTEVIPPDTRAAAFTPQRAPGVKEYYPQSKVTYNPIDDNLQYLYEWDHPIYGTTKVYKVPAEDMEFGANDINGYVVRTPKVRDATEEISVLTNFSVPKEKQLGETLPLHYRKLIEQAEKEGQGLLVSYPKFEEVIIEGAARPKYNPITKEITLEPGIVKKEMHPMFRDEHSYNTYYALPNFNINGAKHILPFDLRLPTQWNSRIVYRKQGGILKAQEGVPEIYGGELNPAVVKPKPVRFILRTDPITKNTPITHSSMKADPINKEDLGFFISKGSDDTTYNLIHANCSDATGECLEVLTGQDFTSGITTPISVSRKVRKVFEKQPEYTESGGGLFNSREQSFVVPWYDYRKAKDLHNETVLNSLLKKYSQDKRIHWSKEREDAIIKNWWEQHPKLKYDLDENNNVVNPSKR